MSTTPVAGGVMNPQPGHLGPLAARFAAAGLPVPIYEDRSPLTYESRRYDSEVGQHTHAVIAAHAAAAQIADGATVRALVRGAIRESVKGRSLGRLDRARARVSGMALQYLLRFTPPPPAVFVGAEHRVNGLGRADLAWEHPVLGVFFDEIKTWRHTHDTLDAATTGQVNRYLDFGLGRWPGRFAGVRVITLGHTQACLWLSPDGDIEPLLGSPLDPSALLPEVSA